MNPLQREKKMTIQKTSNSISILKLKSENYNALSSTVLKKLGSLISELESDSNTRIVILTGYGKSFVAGADISEMQNLSSKQALEFVKLGHDTFHAIEKSRLIFIAAINGFALGGGLELALSCDLRIASENSILGLPEASLGLLPGFGGTGRLANIIGLHHAMFYALTAENIPLDKALELNLILQKTKIDDLLPVANNIARSIEKNGPQATSKIKKLIHQNKTYSNKTLLQEQLEFSKLFKTKEPSIGLNAFLSKKEPNFTSTS